MWSDNTDEHIHVMALSWLSPTFDCGRYQTGANAMATGDVILLYSMVLALLFEDLKVQFVLTH